MTEVIRDGLTYIVEDSYTGKQLQRAAEKLKPYVCQSEIIPEMEDTPEGEHEKEEDVPPPPRRREPPRRLIEECEGFQEESRLYSP